MKRIFATNSTQQRMVIFVQNATSTTGGGLTGVAFSAAGLSWYYYKASGTSTSVTLASATLGTWASGGWKEIDATHLPGFYEIGIPDAVWNSSAPWAVMQLGGAANMVPVNMEIELCSVDPYNANNFGLASLPTAIPAAAGGLVLVGTIGTGYLDLTATGQVDVGKWLGTAVTSNVGVPVVYATGGTITTVTGTVTATVPTVTPANVTQWLGTAVTSNAGVPIVDVAAGTISTVTGTVTATVPSLSTNVNVQQWLGTAVTSNAGIPIVDVAAGTVTTVSGNVGGSVGSVTGTVTATVVGGTIATVTGPVTLTAGQLTVKKNTILNGFTFPMYDATTGNPSTGLTVGCSISIDGAALTFSTNSPAEVGSGIYKLNLAAADVNGTVITLLFTASGASATIVTLITQA